jgi:hypothetical protein
LNFGHALNSQGGTTMQRTAIAALVIGLLGGLLLSPPRALGSGNDVSDSMATSLDRIATALKEISRNVDNRNVCECRCK